MTNARNAKSAREKAAQMRAEAERKAARSRAIAIGAAVVAVLLVVIGGFTLFRTLQKKQDDKIAAASAPPANLYTPDSRFPGAAGPGVGGILYGKADAKVSVDLYEDFMCPTCRHYEEKDKALLRKLADAGTIRIIYRPVAILDRFSSGTEYSTRAVNAQAAVLAVAPDKALAFHDILFANQPQENSTGLTDAQLIGFAEQVGVPRAKVEKPILERTYAGYVTNATNFFTQHLEGTPSLLVNGTLLDLQKGEMEPAALQAKITAAAKG